MTLPRWFYGAGLPVVGWLVLLWAGYETKRQDWMFCAGIYGFLSLLGIIAFPPLINLGWLAGMLHAYAVRESYQQQLSLATGPVHNLAEARVARRLGVQVDINQATQHELVYKLNLPITQANKILALRRGGLLFTSMEEVAGYTGIPLTKLQEVAPIITFGYYEPAVGFERWAKVNTLTAAALSREFGLSLDLSEKLVAIRDQSGAFHSLVDLRERGGLPYDQLAKLC